MLKLNRTTEYSLMALSYIRTKRENQFTSAREISEKFQLPFEILAKTLQRLKEQGIIISQYGTQGGYHLARDLKSLSLAEFLRMMEGPGAIVNCLNPAEKASEKASCACDYFESCGIKGPMAHLNDRIQDFLGRISLEEITRSPVPLAQYDAPFAGEP